MCNKKGVPFHSSSNTNTQKHKKKDEFTLLMRSINIDTNKKQIKTKKTQNKHQKYGFTLLMTITNIRNTNIKIQMEKERRVYLIKEVNQ